MASHATNTLRTINSRLRDHSQAQLLNSIPQISQALLDCKALLSSAPTSSKDSADGVVLHTFKTHITTLVNGRTPEERWAGVILVKATVELGGHEVLQTCKPWVNGMLSLLGKPDTPSTKKLTIITLTRLFVLTQGYQTIVRELTTPSLPTFITSCLELVAPKKPSKAALAQTRTRIQSTLLQSIFECFAELIPRYPTIFRTFTTKLQALLAAFVAPTPSSPCVSNETQTQDIFTSSDISTLISNPATIAAARRLHALIHFSAAKSNDNEYTKRLIAIVDSTHATASAAFRSVREEVSSSSDFAKKVSAETYTTEVSSQHIALTAGLDLPNWRGIHAGCERLAGLIRLLRTYIGTSHTGTASVSIPIGSLIDLVVRITSVTVPPPQSSQHSGLNGLLDTGIAFNDQISREEREALFTQLPTIHAAALDLVSALLRRFDTASASWASILLHQTIWVSNVESYNATVRGRCYKVISQCTTLFGRSFSKDTVKVITPLLRRAANDIIGTFDPNASAARNNGRTASPSQKKIGNTIPTLNADTLLSSAISTALPLFTTSSSHSTPSQFHQKVAMNLLRTALLRLPSSLLSPSLRAHLDRAAIISNDKDAMLASVLNPSGMKALAKSASSILPLLVRAYGAEVEVEGLVRPRMPVILDRHNGLVDGDVAEEDEDEDEEELDGLDETMVEADENGATRDDEEGGINEEDGDGAGQGSISALTSAPAPQSSSIMASPPITRKRGASPLPSEPASNAASASASKKPRITPAINEAPAPQPQPQPSSTAQTAAASLYSTAGADVPLVFETAAPSTTIAAGTGQSQPQTVVVSQVSTKSPTLAPVVNDVTGSDDDDFVMPELTLEPDTDEDEIEEEEEEEEEEQS